MIGLVLLLQFKTHPGGSTNQLADLGPAIPPSQHAAQPRRSAPAGNTASPSAQSRTRTATGHAVQTPYGDVQVRIVETHGQLTDVVPIQLPHDSPRSSEIAANAEPVLRTEALRAGSARIDIVSGATYTSDGYAQSLQSALDSV